MKRDWTDNLAETYPPTPAVFTSSMRRTLQALPERSARWKTPASSVFVYSLAVFATVALLAGGTIWSANRSASPTASPTQKAVQPTQSAQPTPKSTSTPRPTQPPAVPLPQLPISKMAAAPKSSDGWQIAAVAKDAVWYWNPSTMELACAADAGGYQSIALQPSQGQTVDSYTFVASDGGQCIAFTVHGPGGDSVWLVTAKGRKMELPNDVLWVDQVDNKTPLQFDFTGLSMIPAGFSVGKSVTSSEAEGEQIEYSIDGIRVYAADAEGNTYGLDISSDYNYGLTISNCLGTIHQGQKLSLPDESWVVNGLTITPKKVGKISENQYYFGSMKRQVELHGNQFSLFKSQDNYPLGVRWGVAFRFALLIYKDDPNHNLWIMDISTGKTEKVAQGCTAAGWKNGTTYWYATASDKTEIQSMAVKYDKPIEVSMSVGECASNGKVTFQVMVGIRNNSSQDVVIPENIPCSLNLEVNGTPVWSKEGSVVIQDAETGLYNSIISIESMKPVNGQYILKPGCVFSARLPDQIPFDREMTYKLTGTIYDGSPVSYTVEPIYPAYLPVGISITPAMTVDRRLSVTINNDSINGFAVPNGGSTEPREGFPPIVRYRLLSGDTVIEVNKLSLSEKFQSAHGLIIPAGESATLIEAGNPKFANLRAGNYRLECYIVYDDNGENLPWGYTPGLYFNMTFTVPGK